MSAEGKAKLWDTCLEDIAMFHGQSNLTHVLWNHSGNYFTTMDEKGKIVIWANKVKHPRRREKTVAGRGCE